MRMNLNFFSRITALILVLTVGSAAIQPKNAQAGVILGGLGVMLIGGCALNQYDDSAEIVTGIGAFVAGAGGIVSALTGGFGVGGVAGALITLDVDGSLLKSQLEKAFAAKYPFIDNAEATAQLADLVKKNVPADLKLNQGEGFRVSVPADQTLSVLEKLDLTEAQQQMVVDDLK